MKCGRRAAMQCVARCQAAFTCGPLALQMGHPCEKLIERNRIVAHPHAGRVVDGVCDGRGHAAYPELPDSLGPDSGHGKRRLSLKAGGLLRPGQ